MCAIVKLIMYSNFLTWGLKMDDSGEQEQGISKQ